MGRGGKHSNRHRPAPNEEKDNGAAVSQEPTGTILCCIPVKKGTTVGEYLLSKASATQPMKVSNQADGDEEEQSGRGRNRGGPPDVRSSQIEAREKSPKTPEEK
jgi:hypothetical protein